MRRGRDVEKQARSMVSTSVQDALSGAWCESVAVLKRAIQLEQKRKAPRVALVKGLQREIRKRAADAGIGVDLRQRIDRAVRSNQRGGA